MELIASGARTRCRADVTAPSRRRADPVEPLFWPVLALVALLLVDAIVTPGFLSLRMQDGHLYGSLIDILQERHPDRADRPGHDPGHRHPRHRPVGRRRGGHRRPRSPAPGSPRRPTRPAPAPPWSGCCIALGLSAWCSGVWNGFLVAVLGIQPIIATLVLMTAGRGLAQLITDGQIITVEQPAVRRSSAAGSCSGCRSR